MKESGDGHVHTEGESNTSAARAEWQARRQGGRTAELVARDAEVFLRQSLSTPVMSAIAKAEGIWIEDADGRRYMDFHGNSVHHIGYGHPRLIAAIRQQLDTLSFTPRRFTDEPAIELAEKLTGKLPGKWKLLFTTGGSDANEVALKIARAATGRFKTVSFWDAFHGAGLGAASVGGESTFRSHIAGPLLAGTEHVAPYDSYRCPYGHANAEASGDACANMIDYVMEKEGDVAAFIGEPMRATPNPPPPGFWRKVRRICDKHGALMIFDEVPTGLGKTGRFFAHEHDLSHRDGVTPDIVTLGKALGGGLLPIAALLAKAELAVAGDFAIGHYTHEKNPVTARAALTTLQIIEEEGLAERSAELGAYALARLNEFAVKTPSVGNVRGRGLMFGVDLVKDRETKEPARQLAESVFYRCLDKGLSFKISAGSVLTLSPPLTISREDLDRALTIVEEAIVSASDS